mgnify:CR=1 FL=1
MSMIAGTMLTGLLCLFADDARPGQELERKGDEIVVCGRLFHTATPIVLWTDPGGYDAYRVERRFVPLEKASWKETQEAGMRSPNRYGQRTRGLTPEQVERVRGGGWDLPSLQDLVDQFVVHFDACGTSKKCFQVLHDERCLSVHFMLDIDGTIYQTLDLKESAWHATIANGRSIGIEIANVGAYGGENAPQLERWYQRGKDGKVRLTIPGGLDSAGLRDPRASLVPARDELVKGTIQGQELRQYDLTPEQYAALIKLTATLCTVFPKIKCDYPRGEQGGVFPAKLPDDRLGAYQGLLGHYHVQTNKIDPGPAFQWEKLVEGARGLMSAPAGPGPK